MIDSEENKEYLPIQGLEAFNKATADLLLGPGHAATKVSLTPPCQSPSQSQCSLCGHMQQFAMRHRQALLTRLGTPRKGCPRVLCRTMQGLVCTG